MTRSTFRIALLGAAICIAQTRSLAQQPATVDPSPPWTEVSIKSSILGEDRKIFVATPAGYEGAGRAYPVLILLDANDGPQFAAAIANARFLAHRRAIQPLIIVGIPNGKDRTRDLTPVALGSTANRFPTAGGADRFADFLASEVLPAVRSKYRAAPYTILAGHSFGGLFGTHVASTRPGTFNAIIAMSPSLWWSDSAVVTSYTAAMARGDKPLRFFATSGGHEGSIDRTTRALIAGLDSVKPPLLRLGHQRYAEDSHAMTPIISLVDGLRFVFQPISLVVTPFDRIAGSTPDSATMMTTFLETERRYSGSVREFPARDLGIPEALPEDFTRGIGMWALTSLTLPRVAAALFSRNVESYPQSAAARSNLADALLASADTAGARKQYAKGLELARAARDTTLAGSIEAKVERLGQDPSNGKPKPPKA